MLRIYEGEKTLSKDNYFLGEFTVKDIIYGFRGQFRYEVKFMLGVDKLLNAEVLECATGKITTNKIQLEKSKISRSEVDKVLFDAEINKKSDQYAEKKVKALQRLKNLAYQIKYVPFSESILSLRVSSKLAFLFQDELRWIYRFHNSSILGYKGRQRNLSKKARLILGKYNIQLNDLTDDMEGLSV